MRVVCLNCMDGRVQIPVIEWIKNELGEAACVDMVTEPGMDHILAAEEDVDSVVAKIKISIDKNSASIIFVVGHHDCKGNPVTDDIHEQNIKSSAERIKDVFPKLPVFGLWVDEHWNANKLIELD